MTHPGLHPRDIPPLDHLEDEGEVLAHLDHLRRARAVVFDSLMIFVADAAGHASTVIAVDELPPSPPQDERVAVFGPLLRTLRADDDASGVLLAVVRDGPADIDGEDLAWHDAFTGTARVAGLSEHGVYVVHRTGVGRVSVPSRHVA